MKSKKIIIIATLFATLTATAQSKHEFSIQTGGGLSSLNYQPIVGETTPGLGLDAGVGYTYFFNSHWGIGTGAGAKWLTGKYDLPSLTDAFQSHDGTEAFEYRYSLNKYSEKQQALLLTVPLMFHFQSGKFYTALGGKVGLPLSATYKNDLDELRAAGYYAHDDLRLNDPLFMGFGTFNKLSNDADLSLKTAFFASAEVGAKWRLSEKLFLYTGVFVDYGLNNIQKAETAKTLIEYNAAAADAYLPNGILASAVDNQVFVDKITPLSAGIKLILAFGSKPYRKSVQQVVPTTDYPPAQPSVEENIWTEQRKAEAAQKAAEQERLLAEQCKEEQRKEEQRKEEERQYVKAVEIIEQSVPNTYKVNSSALSAVAKTALDEKAASLQRYPNLSIIIEGHTCNIGTYSENFILGERRAQVVKDYLVQKGVSADRIRVVSRGKLNPLVPNTNEENRRKNRRVKVETVERY